MVLTKTYTEITGFNAGMIQVAKNYLDYAELVISTTTPTEETKGFFLPDKEFIRFEMIEGEKLFARGLGEIIVQKGFI